MIILLAFLITSAYAPIKDSEETNKEDFYNKLEELIETVNERDILVVLGDFSAKIGREKYINEVAGKDTIHNTTRKNRHKKFAAAAANFDIN